MSVVEVNAPGMLDLVEADAELERIGSGFTFTEGPRLDEPRRRLAAVLGHARRHAPALDAGRRRRGASRTRPTRATA